MSEEELILRLEKNPDEGFRLIYLRYSGPLFRYVYRFTGAPETAEEILHDVFSELLSLKFTSDHGSLKNWLYTVAKNKSLNFNKRKSYEVVSDEMVSLAEDKVDIEKQMIDKNLLKTLSAAEKILPHDLLQTWSLRKQGFDHQAIGKELSIPVGTVKSRFHRIVEILRKEIV